MCAAYQYDLHVWALLCPVTLQSRALKYLRVLLLPPTSIPACPLSLFLVLMFVFLTAVVVIYPMIPDSGTILMFAWSLVLVLLFWLVPVVVVVVVTVSVVVLGLVVGLPRVVVCGRV